MLDKTNVKTLDKVVVRFSGDSGDGMQLAGNIFTNVSAGLGNKVSTFPDYPAEVRAPQGSLSGVSGFQVSVGVDVHTPGDLCDVLIAMNPAGSPGRAEHQRPHRHHLHLRHRPDQQGALQPDKQNLLLPGRNIDFLRQCILLP